LKNIDDQPGHEGQGDLLSGPVDDRKNVVGFVFFTKYESLISYDLDRPGLQKQK
jgi:hypothetical protein